MRRFLSLISIAIALAGGCEPPVDDEIRPDPDALITAPSEPMRPAAGGSWLASPLPAPVPVGQPPTNDGSRYGRSGLVRYDCAPHPRGRRHNGTDFPVDWNTPVRAAAAGTVTESYSGCPNNGYLGSRCGGGWGNYVIVQHDNGYRTVYAHLLKTGVARAGRRVECGDTIGFVGSSGSSSGPHLHFEVYSPSWAVVDPWGGPCSTQRETLWNGGSPSNSCMEAERDDAVVERATYPHEIGGSPGMRIAQTFRFRNTGNTTWTASRYALVHVSGAFREVREVRLPAGTSVRPGQAIDLRVEVVVPNRAGLHRGAWQMSRIGGSSFGRWGLLAVRVADSPRGCESQTLGRTVAHGACVQVSYPGCGLSSCAWFACADGSWLCTDPSACTGSRHPHPRCSSRTPADAGVPPSLDAGTAPPRDSGAPPVRCETGGIPAGGRCTATSDCCAGLECAADAEGERVCCRGRGSACAVSTDCCGGMECTMGYCACVPLNQLCINDSDCCDGLACIAGACRRVDGCTREGNACTLSTQCCYPLLCNPSSVGGPRTCCVSGGNRCHSDDDCCGEMTCEGGRCRERARGDSCADILDCAGALLCRDGVCDF